MSGPPDSPDLSLRARDAVLGEKGRLSATIIKDRLFGPSPERRINKCPDSRREAAYMAWLVFTFTVEEDRVITANDYLAVAIPP